MDRKMMKNLNLFFKRIFDITASITCILVFTAIPIFIIVPIIVKLTSKGPAIFRQTRVGRNERPFMMLKFRTMIVNKYDAEGKEIMSEHRITKVGRFLRKTSLDEIPQMFNIFLGSMSFVGPRPMLDYQAGRCTEEERLRFSMRPGVTGLAQVKGRNNIDWTERIRYDLEYIRTFNIVKDLEILFKTVLMVFRKEGTDVKPEYRKVDRFSRDYIPGAYIEVDSDKEKELKG